MDNAITNKMSELQKKIDRSVRQLRATCGDLGEVELSYSGGKDSDVILTLAQMAGIPYRAIYKNTTIDPPGTLAHCRAKGVEIRHPKESFWQLVERKGCPSRWVRFCCSELKEYKILDNAIQGIRRCESIKRRDRYKEPTMCRFYGSKKNHVNVILPILDWTDGDVREFVTANGIQCHPLYYDEGGTFRVERRLGCLGCPLQSDRGVADLKRHPRMVREYIRRLRIWRETHPNTESCHRYRDEYEVFMRNKFFDSNEDFRLATTGMFGDIDCKAWLEEYFKIELVQ